MKVIGTKKELLARGSCQEVAAHFFIDCGSGVSLVSPNFLARVKLGNNIKRSTAVLSSFTHDRIPVRGKVVLDIKIAGLSSRQEFLVTEMLDVDFLLGLDFLESNDITIDYGRCTLRTRAGGTSKLFEKPRDVPKIKRIRCKETVVIPPNSVQIISGKIPRVDTNYQGITDPCHDTMNASGVLIGPSIVYTDKSWLPVQCMNIKEEPIVIYKGSTLGYLKPATENGGVHDVNLVGCDDQASVSHTQSTDSSQRTSCRWNKESLFKALKLEDIQISMTKEERSQLEEVLWKYRACFAYDKDDFGCSNMFQAHIDLKRDYTPSWTPERKVPYHLERHMDHLLDNMLSTGVVEPLTTDSGFNSAIFLVSKSTPGEYRVVADLRGVNKQCIPDRYDLPNLNYVLDKIGGDSIFSTFDMAASFHQVPYDESSKPITAFSYRGKRYNYARMVMGHCSSSAIFSRMMHKLLAFIPIEHLIYFLDDLLIGSTDVASHIYRLEKLLHQLATANLKLTPNKTELLRQEVKYVGVTLNSRGISINEERIEAILNLPAPTSRKEVQKVLGFFGYNRRFLKQYAALSKPLYDLLRKDRRFEWTPECSKSFQDLKEAVSSSPTLCYPDVEDPLNSYEIKIDASKYGLGATLTQTINNERRTVSYFSKSVPRHKKQCSGVRRNWNLNISVRV